MSELQARREGDTRKITISAGVAVYPEHGQEYGELMRSVDEALIRASAVGATE